MPNVNDALYGTISLAPVAVKVLQSTLQYLSLSASDLGEGGINPRPTSDVSDQLLTATGSVTKSNLAQTYEITIDLLKDNGTGQYTNWLNQMQSNANLGAITVYTDVANAKALNFYKSSIKSITPTGDAEKGSVEMIIVATMTVNNTL